MSVPGANFVFTLLLVVLLPTIEATEKGDQCTLQTSCRIQLAWVLDRTSEYVHKGSKEMDFTAQLALEIAEFFEFDYPGSEYAVALYSDWPNAAEPPRGPRDLSSLKQYGIGVPDAENCCHFQLNFTKNKHALENTIRFVKPAQSGMGESALTCLLFTAASTSMGWVSSDTDDEGTRVVKFLVIVANEENTELLENPGPRTPPKGDGRDTCSGNLPPKKPYRVVEDVLRKTEITVIGLFDHNPLLTETDPMKIWKEIMSNMDVPYHAFWRKDPETVTELKKVIKETTNEFSGKQTCVWADPPAYNTLGY